MQNKLKLNTILLVIIIILLVVGLVYIFFNNSKQEKENNNLVNNLPQENQAVNNAQADCLPTTTPWIKVLSPNGGEIYNMGDSIKLTWKSCNLSTETPITGELDDVVNPNGSNSNSRSLFCEGSDNPNDLKSQECLNSGNRTIKLLPNIVPGIYKIKIDSSLISPFANDSSDNFFTIQQASGSSENSLTENFINQPGAIKSITTNGINKWILAVDLLSPNTKWIPGVDSPYINQNPKIRNLNVTSATKAYDCGTQYANGNNVGPSLQNISSFITNIQNTITQAKADFKNRVGATERMTDWALARFDIRGTNITAIYQSCLP